MNKTLDILMAAGFAFTNFLENGPNHDSVNYTDITANPTNVTAYNPFSLANRLPADNLDSAGLIERVRNEGARRALEHFKEVKDEIFSTQDFTLTLSAYANNEQVFPALQIVYNGSQPKNQDLKIKFVLCAASFVDNKWQGSCFMPLRRSEQKGPFQPQEIRKAEPKQPLLYPYAANPAYVLLPHAQIEIANEQIDLGTLIGKNVEISPRK
ncbi:MAG: hypothetical protein AABW48_04320 [Nanoarchaeota archaeon]